MNDGRLWAVALGLWVAAAGCSDDTAGQDTADVPRDDGEATGEVAADADADGDADVGPDADVVPDVAPDVAPDVEPDAPADVAPDVVPDAPADVELDVEPDAPADVVPDVPGSPVPECTESSTCTLHTDCCNCLALAPGESPPPCGLTECLVTTCTARGITDADLACAAGRCAVYACETDGVACLMPPPSCPAGEVPSVRGLCWGPCVPATECVSVDDCAACDEGGQFCVQSVSRGGPTTTCVERPAACGDTATCGCVGDSVCVGIFDACSDDGGVLTCSCPTC